MKFLSMCRPVRKCYFALIWLLVLTTSSPVSAQPTGGAAVSFPTRDAKGSTAVTLNGQFWTPSEPVKGVVVLVHGSGGWSDHREGHYGRALSAAGYAALAIDSFGARGIRDTVADQTQISSDQMARDAFAARRFLLQQKFFPNQIALMGFSKGGVVALLAADRNFLMEEPDRFVAAIPFYPGCNARPRVPKPASAVFMALGEKDDYTGVKPCLELAEDYRAAGGKISVKVYPDAAHGFDGNLANNRMFYIGLAENYMACTAYVEEDGQITYAGKKYASNEDTSIISDMRKTCVKKGASVWTNPRQKESATRDVIDFLNNTIVK